MNMMSYYRRVHGEYNASRYTGWPTIGHRDTLIIQLFHCSIIPIYMAYCIQAGESSEPRSYGQLDTAPVPDGQQT